MLVGDGGRPMADAHGERALLDLCNANDLKLSTPSRERSAPCARAAYGQLQLDSGYCPIVFLPGQAHRPG